MLFPFLMPAFLLTYTPSEAFLDYLTLRDSHINMISELTECKMDTMFFFDTAPSFEDWETHRYLINRLGIVRARGGGLLDHPYAPFHPLSVPPTEEHLVGHLTNYCHQMCSQKSI